jgi:hypothetical protein
MIRLITIYISVYIFKTHPVPEHLTFARDLANDDRSCGMFEANQPEHGGKRSRTLKYRFRFGMCCFVGMKRFVDANG